MALKEVFAPHLGRNVKFGRQRPKFTHPHLKLKDYLRASLPSAPSSIDYTAPAMAALSDVFMNDTLGDCGIAGGYHIVGVETGNAGNLFHATQAQILADYSAIGSYVPGDPSTDQGIVLQNALAHWTSNGFANGTRALGYLAVDPTNGAEVRAACWLFENLYMGLELPDTYVNPFPSASGFTWGTGTPDPNNGHCIISPAKYNSTSVGICTWGMLGNFTDAALADLCASKNNGELWVILTPDQMIKGSVKAPNGVAWNDIIADFDSLGGSVPIPTTPTPAPAPSPSPAPAGTTVSLAQVESWLAAGINSGFALQTRSQAIALANAQLSKNWPKS